MTPPATKPVPTRLLCIDATNSGGTLLPSGWYTLVRIEVHPTDHRFVYVLKEVPGLWEPERFKELEQLPKESEQHARLRNINDDKPDSPMPLVGKEASPISNRSGAESTDC